MKVEISMFLRYGFLWYFLSYDASSIIWNFLPENALKFFVFSCKYTFGEPKTAYTARRTRKRRPKGAMSSPRRKARHGYPGRQKARHGYPGLNHSVPRPQPAYDTCGRPHPSIFCFSLQLVTNIFNIFCYFFKFSENFLLTNP